MIFFIKEKKGKIFIATIAYKTKIIATTTYKGS
jgi:hypothetical protein